MFYWLALALVSFTATSSPWIENDDVYLRSSLVALSDDGALEGLTNSYPLRWSSVHQVNSGTVLSYEMAHFKYQRQSAKLSRGNKRVYISGGSAVSTPTRFGSYQQEEFLFGSSYELLRNDYAFRLDSQYSQPDGEVSFKNSYIAFNHGDFLADVSSLPRWWGQGWNNTLILNTKGNDIDLNLSWMGESSYIGNWSLMSLFSYLDDDPFESRASLRISNKPLAWFEYGVVAHHWFSTDESSLTDNDEQIGVDLRVSMPSAFGVSHALYAEVVSTYDAQELGAYLYGWSGLKSFSSNSIRLSLEAISAPSESRCTSAIDETSRCFTQSTSVNSYVQLSNDHQFTVSYVDEQTHNDRDEKYMMSYTIPWLAGKLTVDIERQFSSQGHNTNAWSRYEFRF